MDIDFNWHIDNLRRVLEILEIEDLSEKDRNFYRGWAFYEMKWVMDLLNKSNKEAETIFAQAMQSSDWGVRERAHKIVLQAEALGVSLSKETIDIMKEVEEEISAQTKKAS